MDQIIGVDQSYCNPGRPFLDNLFLMRDVFDVCKMYGLNIGIVSVDQEKACCTAGFWGGRSFFELGKTFLQ